MAAIWADVNGAMSHVIVDNKVSSFIFSWLFVAFEGEKQAMAEIRWRKAGVYPNMHARMYPIENTWTGFASVGRHETDTDIKHIILPSETLSNGIWFFEARMKPVGGEGGDWSGWTTHRIEISDYDDRSEFYAPQQAQVKGPGWPVEGTYGQVVQVMSEAGILSDDSPEVTYNVWETNKFLKLANGNVVAVPEHRNGDGVVGRVTRVS